MARQANPKPVGNMADGGHQWIKDIWIPEISPERRIRVNQLEQELDLEERARSDGRLNRPETGDTTLNEPQLEVCNRIFSGILLLNQFLADELSKALAAARKRKPRKLQIQDYKSKIAYETNGVFAEFGPEINSLRRDDLTYQKDLRYFRSRNKLNRTASYRISLWLPLGLICALFVIESLANGLLFQNIVENGVLGGAFLAALISAINVILGIAAGLYGWRYIGHIDLIKKIQGWSVTILLHLFAIFWNFMAAHFREVAEAAAQNPNFDFNLATLANQAWNHIGAAGLTGIMSIFSWALLALGLIIHFIAAKEGWDDLADRYPDYKKVDRRAREARDRFEEAVVELRADAAEVANDVIREAEREYEASRRDLNAIAGLVDLAQQREKEVRDSEDEWVGGGTQLLKMYRDLNIEIREGDTEPPVYFSNYPSAADYRTRNFGAGARMVDAVDKHVEDAKGTLEKLEALKTDSETIVERNSESLALVRSHANQVLERLDGRVKAAKSLATKEVKEDLQEEEAG